ncbi:MAG TPA: HEAT repeat domain-containing protein [Candidatus Limnocylindria bacterium]|nr:HEAT repeat domain-containing protein [Candidatus Limnocylindria bacterium]
MDSGWFGISDPTGWALLAVGNLSALAAVLTLCAFLTWHRGTEQHRRRMVNRHRWQRLVLEYLSAPTEDLRMPAANQLREAVRASERHDFAGFVLGYLRNLRGTEADSLRELLRSLGLLDLARRELKARNPWRRASAAQLLDAMRAPESVPDLVRAVQDRSVLVSFLSASALVRIGGEEACAAVAEALTRRSDWNPSQIKEILLGGGPHLTDRLVSLLDRCDPNEEKTKLLVELLGILRYGPAAETLLVLLRRGCPEELRVSILRALGRLGYAPAGEVVRAAAVDPSWVVRSQAVLALGRIGDASCVPVLEAALADDQYWVRFNAALALRSLGEAGRLVLARVSGEAHAAAIVAREVLLEDAA